eukprot:3750624-Pleurochrysis_carterae.AAC.1
MASVAVEATAAAAAMGSDGEGEAKGVRRRIHLYATTRLMSRLTSRPWPQKERRPKRSASEPHAGMPLL